MNESADGVLGKLAEIHLDVCADEGLAQEFELAAVKRDRRTYRSRKAHRADRLLARKRLEERGFDVDTSKTDEREACEDAKLLVANDEFLEAWKRGLISKSSVLLLSRLTQLQQQQIAEKLRPNPGENWPGVRKIRGIVKNLFPDEIKGRKKSFPAILRDGASEKEKLNYLQRLLRIAFERVGFAKIRNALMELDIAPVCDEESQILSPRGDDSRAADPSRSGSDDVGPGAERCGSGT